MKIGIEHEFVFVDQNGIYKDYSNTNYSEYLKIIDSLPLYESDAEYFGCKSLENSPKRWYIEGFERYTKQGRLYETIPKAIELRTTPHKRLKGLIDEFSDSFNLMGEAAAKFGCTPVLVSHHPYKKSFELQQKLNGFEESARTREEYLTACRSMIAHGMDINISIGNDDKREIEDILKKIRFYLPFMIPFSFSSPFCGGEIFNGLCYRNYSLAEKRNMVKSFKRNGVNIIEFKGFDACGDKELLAGLGALIKGVVLDKTLQGRSPSQDIELLKRSTFTGFEDRYIKEKGLELLNAAKGALKEDESKYLNRLFEAIESNDSYSKRIKKDYIKNRDIIKSISNLYDYS